MLKARNFSLEICDALSKLQESSSFSSNSSSIQVIINCSMCYVFFCFFFLLYELYLILILDSAMYAGTSKCGTRPNIRTH